MHAPSAPGQTLSSPPSLRQQKALKKQFWSRLNRMGFAFLAVFAFLALMLATAVDEASAQRRGGFGGGGFGGGGFGRGGGFGAGGRSFGGGRSYGAGNRSFGGGRFTRPQAGRGAQMGGARYGRHGTVGGRGARSERGSRMGRGGATRGRTARTHVTRPTKKTSKRYPDIGKKTAATAPPKKPPQTGCRRASSCPPPQQGGGAHKRGGSYADGGAHRRGASTGEGGAHRRGASSGEAGTHRRGTSYADGGTHRRGSSAGEGGAHRRGASTGEGGAHRRGASYGDGGTHRRGASYGDGGTHRRGTSAGDGHRRYASTGGNHYRYGSGGGGHHRRTSFASVPPFTPPVPPPAVDPPPPPPPQTASSGGGSGPPRTGGPATTPPPQRASRVASAPPPAGETRYIPDQVIVVLRDDLTEGEIDQFARDNGLARTAGGSVRIGVMSVRIFRFRILNRNRSVPAVIAQIANDPRAVSWGPNYVYALADMHIRPQVTPMVRTQSGLTRAGGHHSMQYVIAKLRLYDAHQVTRGERVLIAVIDSGVDVEHPELDGVIVQTIDVTEDRDRTPHQHGTAMTGAMVSQSQILGVAPAARVIAIRAFSPRSRADASGTTFHIVQAIDRAVQAGARIINMSLAGAHDPFVEKAVQEAHARGVVLVAAAGNFGPSAPPAYPAAYPQVIAVTATDSQDRLYNRANRGGYIVVSAPGVDVWVAHPRGAYGHATGTSVAAAHISGIVALMLARNPTLDPDAVREFLVRSVRAASANGRDEQYGYGHASAYTAVVAVGPPQPGTPVAGGGNGVPTQ